VACDGGALEGRCCAQLVNDLSVGAIVTSGPRRLGRGYARPGRRLRAARRDLADRARDFRRLPRVTVLTAAVLFVALRAGGLSRPSEREPRYDLRLGLGVLALGVSLFLALRKPRPPDPDKKPNLVMRMAARPGPRAAFAVGVLVFTPSITFVAAVQVIATSNAPTSMVVVGLVLVAAIDAMFAWLPLLLFMAAPELTTRRLKELDRWLHSHGRQLLVVATAIAGLALVADGIAGLAG
jgi:hypothetical protein